jgi:chromosome segregation ATPase
MDGAATMSEICRTFRTPVRILLPKLLKSRNDWKAKSAQRKTKLKAAQIKIRDLSASRELWRKRAQQLEKDNGQLREQAAKAARELEQTRAASTQLENAQKK